MDFYESLPIESYKNGSLAISQPELNAGIKKWQPYVDAMCVFLGYDDICAISTAPEDFEEFEPALLIHEDSTLLLSFYFHENPMSIMRQFWSNLATATEATLKKHNITPKFASLDDFRMADFY